VSRCSTLYDHASLTGRFEAQMTTDHSRQGLPRQISLIGEQVFAEVPCEHATYHLQ
jgi:hypothetical protein